MLRLKNVRVELEVQSKRTSLVDNGQKRRNEPLF